MGLGVKPRPSLRAATGLGLAVLFIVNLFPVFLVIRQGLTPESATSGWPLPLFPDHFSTENLSKLWRTQSLLEHVGLSLWVAIGTTLLSIAVGFPAGWAAARSHRIEAIMTRLSLASRILPPIAIAIPLAALLIQARLYNRGDGLGLILAHLTMGLPFAILMAYAAFRDLPQELEQSAHVDGCSHLGAFLRVSLRSVRGAIGAAFILVFLLSWDEFLYALLLQPTHRTMPPLVYYYTQYGEMGSASALAMIMLVPAVLVIAILQRLLARGALVGGVNE